MMGKHDHSITNDLVDAIVVGRILNASENEVLAVVPLDQIRSARRRLETLLLGTDEENALDVPGESATVIPWKGNARNDRQEGRNESHFQIRARGGNPRSGRIRLYGGIAAVLALLLVSVVLLTSMSRYNSISAEVEKAGDQAVLSAVKTSRPVLPGSYVQNYPLDSVDANLGFTSAYVSIYDDLVSEPMDASEPWLVTGMAGRVPSYFAEDAMSARWREVWARLGSPIGDDGNTQKNIGYTDIPKTGYVVVEKTGKISIKEESNQSVSIIDNYGSTSNLASVNLSEIERLNWRASLTYVKAEPSIDWTFFQR
jgi:hypothetical protein